MASGEIAGDRKPYAGAAVQIGPAELVVLPLVFLFVLLAVLWIAWVVFMRR